MLTSADIQFILDNEGADTTRLLLGSTGKGKKKVASAQEEPAVNLPLCAKCIQARVKMKVKAPLWHNCPSLVYPFSVSVEQGSSQATALFKQRIISDLLSGKEIITADLTGGMGIDSYFISRISGTHYYFERNTELCAATEYNFGQLGAGNIVCNNIDITENNCAALRGLEGKGISLIYIDPARRTQSGGKAILLQDYEPNILELQERLFAVSRYILVKVSPMADIKLNLKHLPQTAAIWVVAVENECKELLFLLDRQHNGSEPPVFCCDVDIFNVVTITEEEQAVATYATEVGKYLYEPNKALLKAGAFKLISQRYGCRKLAISTHLYTSDNLIENFPGKTFIVEESIPFNKKALKEIASRYPKADIIARNFVMDTNALKKLSGIKDGGNRHIFATTLSNGNKVIVLTCPNVQLSDYQACNFCHPK